MITGLQIRMARAALRWKVDHVADAAEISWAMAQKLERTDDVPNVREDVLSKVCAAFENAGIVFEAETETGHGTVRLTKRPTADGDDG